MLFLGDRNLECIVHNTEKLETIQKSPVITSPGSTVKWIGFSETSASLPAVYDSKGVLSVLFKQRRPDQATWVPIFDGAKAAKDRGLDEKYWPVGLLRDQLMCLVLKGKIEYPYFPRPIISNIELQIPFLHMDAETTKLEESYVRNNVMTTHERDEATATSQQDEFHGILNKADIEMDKTLLRLIQMQLLKLQAIIDYRHWLKDLIKSKRTNLCRPLMMIYPHPLRANRSAKALGKSRARSLTQTFTTILIFSSSNSSLSSQLAFREPVPSLFSPSVRNVRLAQRKRDQMLSQDTDNDFDEIP
ncbi:hypothetical protein INT43_002944, partial [Umbelopsis isabellina]